MPMQLYYTIVIIMFSFLFSACADEAINEGLNPSPSNAAEQVYINARIYTVDENKPWAEAMYVKEGIIEMIGTETQVQDAAPENAEIIDMEGAFIMPGIHDVHMHPLEASSNNFKFIVNENISDPEDYAIDVEEAHLANPGNDWLLGWGYDLETLFEAERIPKAILDDISTDRPIAVMEQTSHSVWVNSKALEMMGIDSNTENPTGGIIMRETDGEANGILIDNAGNIAIDLALPVSEQSRQNDYDGLVEFALPELASNGITSICDARAYWKREHHLTWKKLANDDMLTLRVNLGIWAYPAAEDDSQLASIKSFYDFDQNSLLKINQIKLYSDGIIHNTTAAMHEDYMLDYFGEITNNGLNYFTEERMAKYIAELDPLGFDFHIHTIGIRGVHEALNAIAQSGSSNARHRLTHVEYVDPQDYPRFAALNVTADAQVAGDFTNPAHWHDFDFLIGSAINENNIPIKSLSEQGARITLSSDWDVSDLNPFIGMQNAVTRNPQAISLEQAVKAYTLNAAYVMRQEEIVGSLVNGKEADFIVLDRNIFDIDPGQISQTKVLETYLLGELVYKR